VLRRLGPGRGRSSANPVRIRPGGGNPPIQVRPRPPIGREGPGGGFRPPGGYPIRPIGPEPVRPPIGYPGRGGGPFPPGRPPPFGGGGGTDILHNPYLRDLRRGISEGQFNRLQSGRLPGMEHGDFVGLGRAELQRLAGTLHQVDGQYTSAPVWPGREYPGGDPNGPPRFFPGGGSGGIRGFQPPGGGYGRGGRFGLPYRTEQPPIALRRLLQGATMEHPLTQLLRQQQIEEHPVDQVLGFNHGLHPAQVQMLRDQYDNNLLQGVAQQGAMQGGMF
jgi:hypothetical protein